MNATLKAWTDALQQACLVKQDLGHIHLTHVLECVIIGNNLIEHGTDKQVQLRGMSAMQS